MKNVIGFCIGLACFGAVPTVANAADCDFNYTIQEGDSLPSIAAIAYGVTNYDFIFLRNPNLAGRIGNPPVGEVIVIPCIPGDLEPDAVALNFAMGVAEAAPEPEAAPPAETEAQTEAEGQADPQPAETEAANIAPAVPSPALSAPELRILTASDMPLYSSEASREGGMVTELMRQAITRIGIEDHKITTVDYRPSHLEALLIEGPYDIGYPWARPPCEDRDQLAELAPEEAYLCDNFEFSEPYYEYVNGFFVRTGEYADTRTEFAAFSETRICRPAGGSMTDLEVRGIIADEYVGAKFVRPTKMTSCVALLLSKDVDAISGEVSELESALTELDALGRVEELPALSVLWTIHSIAPTSKPGAVATLRQMNEVLIDQKISGEWFRTVSRHLSLN